MTVKTDISRFDIHDELTAPEGSERILKSASSAGGEVSKFVGVLAGSPAALRAYARMRSELRGGDLPRQTRERIARARAFASSDPREAALLAFLESLVDTDGHPQHHLLEEARETGWTDEQILEAIAHVALSEFQSLVAN